MGESPPGRYNITMKLKVTALLLVLAALPAAAQVPGLQLPSRVPGVPYQLPGIQSPAYRFPGANPGVGLPIRLPGVPLVPVFNRPSISLPSPAIPQVVAVVLPVTLPVIPAIREMLSRKTADQSVSLEALNKAFDNAGGAPKAAVAVSAPSEKTPEAPKTQEPVKVQKAPEKHLTLPEWDLENEIGQP